MAIKIAALLQKARARRICVNEREGEIVRSSLNFGLFMLGCFGRLKVRQSDRKQHGSGHELLGEEPVVKQP